MITRALNSPSDRLAISSLLSSLPKVLHCCLILALFLCLGPLISCKGVGVFSSHLGRANLLAVLQRYLWGRGQRGNNAAPLFISSPLFNELSCETGSSSHLGNHHSPQPALSLSFPLSQLRLHDSLPLLRFSLSSALPVWLFCLTISLIPWLSEFHAV